MRDKLTGKKAGNFPGYSVVMSAAIKAAVDALYGIPLFAKDIPNPAAVKFTYWFIAAALAIIEAYLLHNIAFRGYLRSEFGVAPDNDVWMRTFGNDGMCIAYITLINGECVYGVPSFFNDDNIVLTRFAYVIDGNVKEQDNTGASVTIPVKNILKFETYYEDGAELQKFNMKEID